jgi:hypothetical protein
LPELDGITTNGDDPKSVLFENQVPLKRVSGREGQGRPEPNSKLCIMVHIPVTPLTAFHDSSTMKVQAPGPAEMLVSISKTTRCHTLKGLFSTFTAMVT